MKNLLKAGLVVSCVCLIALMLTACGGNPSGGDTSKAEIKTVDSELYSQEDINAAADLIYQKFQNDFVFKNFTLKSLRYAGDQDLKHYQSQFDHYSDEMKESLEEALGDKASSYDLPQANDYKEYFDVDDLILFYCDFDTDDTAGEQGFHPNDSYKNYSFVLGRKSGGAWEIKTQGY